MTAVARSGAANHAPLSPIGFLKRSATIFPDKCAVIDGSVALTYAEFHRRALRLGAALAARGLAPGDTVAVIAPNTHVMLEAHFGVGMAGCVLNAINTRLDADSAGHMLRHGAAKLVIADDGCSRLAQSAAAGLPVELVIGNAAYEDLLRSGATDFEERVPLDERDPIALNYTSGTTGRPKGVVYHHRGACLNAMSNALAFGLSPESVYLWTLPMFHCNGWSHPWAVTLIGGTHICLPETRADAVFELIGRHQVTHLAGAPVVLNMLANAAPAGFRAGHRIRFATGGAPPPASVIAAMEKMGFGITHLYGQTESYGPSLMCFAQPGWDDLSLEARAALAARQGQAMPSVADVIVADPQTCLPVAWDGLTTGEILVRGNTIMKEYLKEPEATAEAFLGGWLHSGDIAVRHPDGYIEIKDRAKDIIISGGENISSVEVETVLYQHPAVLEAAVVAAPHPKWGETPCAFVTLKTETDAPSAEQIIGWCRDRLAHFKCPTQVVFGELPKTATGKIMKTELRARARAIAPQAAA